MTSESEVYDLLKGEKDFQNSVYLTKIKFILSICINDDFGYFQGMFFLDFHSENFEK